MKILFVPLWMLANCMGCAGLIIAALPSWGNQSFWWGLGFLFCNMLPPFVLAKAFDDYARTHREKTATK